ncbi:hypothetical protein PanWU01x14_095250 [Parasponia andersonii]|uniref:Uncharacterized protein n=1 Tax=Parasponia andersonii TaxID=3476 RepID=A0A2P5D5I1_PARAD|nr:hypothetical protein PanWU01x14_095250 [Parasponia andersonii]
MCSHSKTVQELTFNGEQVPENYIYKDGYSRDPSAPLMEIPVIDIYVGLLGTSPQEFQKLKSTLSKVT